MRVDVVKTGQDLEMYAILAVREEAGNRVDEEEDLLRLDTGHTGGFLVDAHGLNHHAHSGLAAQQANENHNDNG